MLSREEIAALIPHQGTMCLLERVVEWNAERVIAATRTHCSPENPLRSAARLRSLMLCEYGAQAMALHGGLTAQAAGRRAQPGMIVSLRDVQLHRDYVDDLGGELIVEARRLLAGASSWQYSFSVQHSGALLAAGRAAVIQRRSEPSD
ncbi:MAG TPA: hypothetical protein VMG11_13335 [Steroidobacteraceae bacterium]|nr:hypothetical protein [Steroidobacteraceae bacterium]